MPVSLLFLNTTWPPVYVSTGSWSLIRRVLLPNYHLCSSLSGATLNLSRSRVSIDSRVKYVRSFLDVVHVLAFRQLMSFFVIKSFMTLIAHTVKHTSTTSYLST